MKNARVKAARIHLIERFQHWLHLPDPTPVYAVLGTYVANRCAVRLEDEGVVLTGSPTVWTLLVGESSSGKTEILNSILGLPHVYPTSTMTEASLLSGTAAKERAEDATGGLLAEIDRYGNIICKDFGSNR